MTGSAAARCQDDAVRLLSDLEEATPQIIETHISQVLLFAGTAYKLKKPVALPYLDFTDPQRRLALCNRELELNRRTAPFLYRKVHTITREPDGHLALDGSGTLVEAVLEMARFEQTDLLDHRAKSGELDPALLDELAEHIATFHEGIEPQKHLSGHDVIMKAHHANVAGFAETMLAEDPSAKRLLEQTAQSIEAHAAILEERARAGFVRRGHGDLHLRNICIYEGRPALFDCLEFDEELATTDVLYDLAFLLMDLWHRDRKASANRVFNRYLDATGDVRNLSLLPLFMSLRASVRAHVSAAQAPENPDAESRARSYLTLAQDLLRENRPRLIAIGGLSGSGKSTAATAIAPLIAAPPGARILSTDRIRKALANVRPTERLPEQAYSRDMSDTVYAAQRRKAADVLAGGGTAIADGVFLRSCERDAIAAIARQSLVPFQGFWLEAPRDRLVSRVEARRGDPSDATAQVVDMQVGQAARVEDWLAIDAARSADQTRDAILHKVGNQPE